MKVLLGLVMILLTLCSVGSLVGVFGIEAAGFLTENLAIPLIGLLILVGIFRKQK